MLTSTIDENKLKKIRGRHRNPSRNEGDQIRKFLKHNPDGYLELNLRGKCLVSVPREVFGYATIQILVLSNNGIEHLPPAISMLTRLESLQLEKNKLRSLPEEMQQCQQLRYLDMSCNWLKMVPPVLVKLRCLKILYMAHNLLSYLPKNFGCLVHLRVLNLRGNKLKTLPNSAEKLNKLKELDLSANLFDEIPPTMSSMARLRIFNIGGNSLLFAAPCLDKMKRLQEVNFSRNIFEIAFVSMSKLKNVQYLNVSYTHLAILPTFLLRLPQLKILHVQGNQIAHFPDGFMGLTHLNLANNCVKEFSVHKMKNLRSLNINKNLMKNVPAGLCNLKKLEHFTANGNQIGTIPREMKELKKLRILDVGNNMITYQPQWIKELVNLEYFNIQGNIFKQQQPKGSMSADKDKTLNLLNYEEQYFKKKPAIRWKGSKGPLQFHHESKASSPVYNKNAESKKHFFQERQNKTANTRQNFFLKTMPGFKRKGLFHSDNAGTYTICSLSPMDEHSSSAWVYPVRNTYITYNYVMPEGGGEGRGIRKRHNAVKTFSGQESRSSYFSSEEKIESLTSNESFSSGSEHDLTDLYEQCLESNKNNTCLSMYPKLKEQDEMSNCCCQKHSYREITNELVKVIKETFSISGQGGRFFSSLNPNICLHIPTHNLDHLLQLTMKVVSISEEAIHGAQQRDSSLGNVLSLSAAVMLTPSTDVPFEAPLHISLPAPRTVDRSGYLHVLTARDDNSCTPFFRKYSLKNGCISLKTYHLSGKVAVITKSKCHYKACKSTETLLMKFLH